jgi:hypothetical protein
VPGSRPSSFTSSFFLPQNEDAENGRLTEHPAGGS